MGDTETGYLYSYSTQKYLCESNVKTMLRWCIWYLFYISNIFTSFDMYFLNHRFRTIYFLTT